MHSFALFQVSQHDFAAVQRVFSKPDDKEGRQHMCGCVNKMDILLPYVRLLFGVYAGYWLTVIRAAQLISKQASKQAANAAESVYFIGAT